MGAGNTIHLSAILRELHGIMIRFSLVSLFLMFPTLGVVHSFHSSKPITLLKTINV